MARDSESLTSPTVIGDTILHDEAATAQLLGFSANYLKKQRVCGQAPPHIRISPRRIVYDQRDISEWLAARRQA